MADRESSDLERFRELFWTGFGAPTLQADRFRDVYGDLEAISEALAGPLYTIFASGNCDYVFSPNETRFSGVRTADDFLQWCLELVRDYETVINDNEPGNALETADREFLLKQGDAMEELSHLAHRIMKNRLHSQGRQDV